MLKAFVSLSILVLGVSFAQAQGLLGIKGEDDRRLEETAAYPWGAIGRLNMEENGFCTAALIGPDVGLTAAHCLWQKKRQKWMPPHRVHFLAGYRRGEWIDHATVKSFHISPSYDPQNRKAASHIQHDWAVLRLNRPIGDKVGSLALSTGGYGGQPLTQAGYSQDKAHILSVNEQCRVLGGERAYTLLYHYCDTVSGDSGSPLFYRVAGIPYISHIHVATVRQGQVKGLAISTEAARAYIRKQGIAITGYIPKS